MFNLNADNLASAICWALLIVACVVIVIATIREADRNASLERHGRRFHRDG